MRGCAIMTLATGASARLLVTGARMSGTDNRNGVSVALVTGKEVSGSGWRNRTLIELFLREEV